MAIEVLTYNNVPLQNMTSKYIGRHNVMSEDGTTYLYTQWLFDVTTQLNPATIGFILQKINQGGVGSTTNSPALIDSVIRKLLNQPRKSLVFSQSQDGKTFDVVLNVPNNPTNFTGAAQGLNPVTLEPLASVQRDVSAANNKGNTFFTDAANGPIVEDFDIIKDHASHTWMVLIKISAKVRECPFRVNPIISHRWRRTMDTDEQHLSYVQTDGEVIFDSAWLLSLPRLGLQNENDATQASGTIPFAKPNLSGQFPDQYRLDLFQPIPPNCVREAINVEQDSDGITYRYSYRDQEKFFNTLPACTFDAWQTEGFSQQAQESAIAEAVSEKLGDPHATAIAFGPGGILATRLSVAIRTCPRYYSHFIVKATGNRDTPKWTLLTQAYSIILGRIQNIKSVEFLITWELSGKSVEVQYTTRTGPEEAKNAQALAILDAPAAAFATFVQALKGNFNLQRLFGNAAPGVTLGVGETVRRMLSVPENDPNGWFDQQENVTRAAFISRVTADARWLTAFPNGPGQYYGNLNPPHSNYTRGTLVCNLIAQALHSPCTPPPCPPAVYDDAGNAIQYGDAPTCSSVGTQPTVGTVPGPSPGPQRPGTPPRGTPGGSDPQNPPPPPNSPGPRPQFPQPPPNNPNLGQFLATPDTPPQQIPPLMDPIQVQP